MPKSNVPNKLIYEIEDVAASRSKALQSLKDLEQLLGRQGRRGYIDETEMRLVAQDINTIRKELTRLHEFAKWLRDHPERAADVSYPQYVWYVKDETET